MKTSIGSNTLIDIIANEKATKQGCKMVRDYNKVVKKKPVFVARSADKKTSFIGHISQERIDKTRDEFDAKNSIYLKFSI